MPGHRDGFLKIFLHNDDVGSIRFFYRGLHGWDLSV